MKMSSTTTTTMRQPGDIVNEVYSHNIPSLIQMCEEVGDDPNPLIEQVKHELQKMVAEMMAEDDALLERKRAELAPIRTQYESLFHELHPEKSTPQYSTTLPVLPALRKYIEEHKKLKVEHEKLLQSEPDIRREERQLCNELNEVSLQIENSNFYSKQLVTQISLLSEHIQQLREEKEKRLNHLLEILRNLNEYEEVYGWKRPKDDTLIRKLLTLTPIQIDQFPLTRESLELVDQEFDQIVEQIQKAEAEFEASHAQLTKLMRKHQSLIPNEKTLAISKTKKCRISKLPDLIAEVDRYTEHAMDKLTNDILKVRERIQKIMTKLSIGDVSNDSKYAILSTNDFTEDIYFMHEELAQELEAQYEMNRSIYEQLEHWNELFLEYQEFERNASDPQRFHRRGYSALAEDRTRKKLEGQLRECEHRLENLGEEFQIKNSGQVFRMNPDGKEILDYLNERKDEYAKMKEREREAAKASHSNGTVVGRTPLKVKQALSGTIVGKTPMKTKAALATSTLASRTLSKSKHTLSGSIVGQTPIKTKASGLPPGGKTPIKAKGNLH